MPESGLLDQVKVVNDADGAGWVFGDKTQARQPALVGWRKVSDTVASNLAGAMRSAKAAVSAYLKTK